MNVSIIIPAYNASQTIAETLESVRVQTYPNWEAIIVDDGSTDETTTIAADFATQDARFRCISQPHLGGCAARNKGISLAHFDWLLFLDADDWLLPRHLERMTAVLQADSTLDAVHCGWIRVAPDATRTAEKYWSQSGDLFAAFARTCAFAIHACIVRRSLAEAVGGFDTSFRTCQDWDFWQRVARTGAQFGAVHEVLACYRTRPGSISLNGMQLLTDGLRVISQGHSLDPRVLTPALGHINGLSPAQLSSPKLEFACWVLGLVLSSEQDIQLLLEIFKDTENRELRPSDVATRIFEAVLLSSGRPVTGWDELWPQLHQRVAQVLDGLEAQSQAPGLARRTLRCLERVILENSAIKRPFSVGATRAVRLEVTSSIPDIAPPPSVERLRCEIELEGKALGAIELPVCDSFVPAYVIADAITAEYAWLILGYFFERTLYPQLKLERKPPGLIFWRGSLCLSAELPGVESEFWLQVHHQIGWTLFLQELWARPTWSNKDFYDPKLIETFASSRSPSDDQLTLEVSQELPDVVTTNRELEVIVTVGGVALGRVLVPVEKNKVSAQELRAALTLAGGFELCRLAVREGLIGQSFTEPLPLRERLADAAKRRYSDRSNLELPNLDTLAPSLAHTIKQSLGSMGHGVVLGRRMTQPIGTSASRRAILPSAAWPELNEAALQAGEPIIPILDPNELPGRVVYAPDLIWNSTPNAAKLTSKASWSQPHHLAPPDPTVTTPRLPILLYHRVTPAKSSAPAHYQITPDSFKEQLQYLREAGYYSINLDDWRLALETKRPLPGRAVLFTFDGGYVDFLNYAWPWLKKYGFSATVLLVASEVGGVSQRYSQYGEEVRLLNWSELNYLRDEGVEFGSLSLNRFPLTALPADGVVRDAARSRQLLEQRLGVKINTFAYPYGDTDQVVQHLVGACGYVFGLSCRRSLSHLNDSLLALPRIETGNLDELQRFISKSGV